MRILVFGLPGSGKTTFARQLSAGYAYFNADENLRKWFKDEDWVRIDTQGNIAGKCGTMKKGKKTQRCLPRAKANRLSKKERAATSRKKTASKKQYVKNTKKAKVKLKK